MTHDKDEEFNVLEWQKQKIIESYERQILESIEYAKTLPPLGLPHRRISVARLILISVALVVAIITFAIFTFWLFGSNQPVGAFYLSAKEINR